ALRMRKRPFRGYCAAGCGNPVFARRPQTTFCSLTCSNSRFRKHIERRPCLVCGNIVPLAKQTFCSQACHRKNEFERRRKLLESGAYCGVYNCNGYVRKYLAYFFGEKCSQCGWNERHPKTGKVPVEVEHIDGDWRNNRVENLTLLCPNCHSLTPTFRGLNRGKGRATRLGGREHPLAKHKRDASPRTDANSAA
ncbi:MAG TPA: HNH endonuclease signature motif containing protein, partial [Candidatus Baltobacteraceae bacterium]|nr:HNH endonuclease signature motif containing protein [Candidatus Baltobacteraceae bacterium]